jgi:membrane protease subunit HflC
VVDAFARYRITNPLRFYQSAGSINQASSRLAAVLNSAVRRVLGDATFFAVVRDDRPELMALITEQVNREAQSFGINVIDVRIRRADLPQANSEAIYRRMQTERQQEASQIRAEGEEEARRIRARSDRDSIVIVAEANRDSEQIRGEGDAERNAIFAEAFNQDPDFFAFYRSMQAYDQALAQQDTRFLLSPNSDFFRYFGTPFGSERRPGIGGPPAAPAE